MISLSPEFYLRALAPGGKYGINRNADNIRVVYHIFDSDFGPGFYIFFASLEAAYMF
jgi:hypothetical protein